MRHLRKKVIALVSIAICLVALSSFARAHEGLHEQIVAITAKIKRDPKNASLYLQRGELHRLHRDWARALADYDRAARLQPDLKIVDLARGKMFFESGRLQRAKFTLDRFLTRQPGHYEGLITRARVLAKLGARSDAVNDFTHALALSPMPEPELYLERAQVMAGDEQRVGEALAGLDEGIQKIGPLVTLQQAAIDLELRRRNYDGALSRLDLIAAQSARKEAWLVRRGEILKAAGREEEARAAFNAALVAIESLPAQLRQSRTVTALQLRAHSAVDTLPHIGVDQRVELMAIIFRLAGNREYNQGKLQPYVSEIDRHFGPFREHEAIKLATEMREKIGVGFDTVMYLAVNMNNVRDLQERVPFDAPGGLLRERGLSEQQAQQIATAIRKFLSAARTFVTDSKAQEFFAAHQKFYDAADTRLRALVKKHADFGWFDRFYGKPPAADFFVVPLLANSETNFAPRVPGIGVRQELYAVLTTSKTDAAGLPVYDEGKVGTLVHEFSHSFINPLIESRKDQFQQPAQKIFVHVKEALSEQAYGAWRLMIIESAVRAATARYILAHEGATKAREEVIDQQGKGYLHLPELFDLLGEYERDRKKYPTFESFMPRIVSFFEGFAERVETVKTAYEAKRPKVVSLSIENGAKDVDPNLTEIVVRFDRPMRKSLPALNYDLRPAPGGRDRFPEIGSFDFDEQGTAFRMRVKLQPARDYELFLNRASGGAFAGRDGVLLAPYRIQFRTR